MTAGEDELNLYRSLCWNEAVKTFGTSKIFERRARQRHNQLRWVNYVGVAVPLIIGALVLSFGKFGLLPVAVAVAGVIGVLQVAVNLWSLVAGWIEDYSYSVGSASANDSLSTRFRQLAENPPAKLTELRKVYDKLKIEDESRRERDTERDLSEEERRMGMRAGLRQFRRPCATCKEEPKSMTPTSCDTCGNFNPKLAK